MYKIISVVFTNRKLDAVEISKLPQYSFICNEKVKEGDLNFNKILYFDNEEM